MVTQQSVTRIWPLSVVRVALSGLSLFLILLSPLQGWGIVTCHCFKQREFEPARPATVDPYILATARNSLLAASSGYRKGDVVRERMTGATESDLWFSLFLAARTGTSPGALREARTGAGSWKEALDALSIPTGKLGPAFEEARRTGEEEAMSQALADLALVNGFKVSREVLARLRSAGAGNAEAVLSLLLAQRTRRDPGAVLEDVTSKRHTWGWLLHAAGIVPESLTDIITAFY